MLKGILIGDPEAKLKILTLVSHIVRILSCFALEIEKKKANKKKKLLEYKNGNF